MTEPEQFWIKRVVTALQFAKDGSNWEACLEFLGAPVVDDGPAEGRPEAMDIYTESGCHQCDPGDWIVVWDDEGHLSVMEDEDFRRAFTPVVAS